MKQFSLKFNEGKSGLWFCEGECDDDRTLFVSHRSLDAIIADLPAILRQWTSNQWAEAGNNK